MTHNASSNSTAGGLLSSPNQLLLSLPSSPGDSSSFLHHLNRAGQGSISVRSNNNVSSFVEECFTNNTGDAENITVNNASVIIGHCFSLYKLEHVTHHTTAATPLGSGTFVTPGQLLVTGVKHPSPKHSAAYNIGYKLGSADGKIGGTGLPDGPGACNGRTGVNGTAAATNQCLAGYFAAWNRYCPTSRYGCNS